MKKKPTNLRPEKLDAEKILNTLAEIRSQIPFLGEKPAPALLKNPGFDGLAPGMIGPDAMEDFAYEAVAEGLESLASELSAVLDEKRQKLIDNALDIYYAAEELARDPEHADLIAHVETMRKSYESDFGHPVPSKAETMAERARRKK
jgi:hypothetical protein